eukprot:TRINITY_DN38608_c0_g1_i1.p1 TRINITY_DN38608_c0_g1~~TRINITY_DN38608_c0_g1_i1.p1  ORF type:complete len:930 (+),score=80.09 TRINITY_DN38608_c0_g1_i1:64-2853(+)
MASSLPIRTDGNKHRPKRNGESAHHTALQLGVRWQMDAGKKYSPVITHRLKSPKGASGRGRKGWRLCSLIWRSSSGAGGARQSRWRMRSSYVFCLLMAAVLAMINGIFTVFTLDKVLGAQSSAAIMFEQLLTHTSTTPRLDSLRSLRWARIPAIDIAAATHRMTRSTLTPSTKDVIAVAQEITQSASPIPSTYSTASPSTDATTPFVLQTAPENVLQTTPEDVQNSNVDNGEEESSRVTPQAVLESNTVSEAPLKATRNKDPEDWVPSSNNFLRFLEDKWVVNAFSSEPGVYVLQQKNDYSCILLLQDVCYVFMEGESNLHNPKVGVWFAQDLPRPDTPDSTTSSDPESDSSDPDSPPRHSVLTRDLSKVDMSQDVCTLFNPRDDSSQGPFAPDTHDLLYVKERELQTYGRFVGRFDLADYIEKSTNRSRRLYMEEPPVEVVDVGILTRHESYEATLGELAVPFTESARHLSAESSGRLGANSLEGEGTGSNSKAGGATSKGGSSQESLSASFLPYTVFFPSEDVVRSHWTTGISRMLLGEKTVTAGGHIEGSPACFRNAAFMLNARHTNESSDLLRVLAYRAVDSGIHQVASEKRDSRREQGSPKEPGIREASIGVQGNSEKILTQRGGLAARGLLPNQRASRDALAVKEGSEDVIEEGNEVLARDVESVPPVDFKLGGGEISLGGNGGSGVLDLAWTLGAAKGAGSSIGRSREGEGRGTVAESWEAGLQITVADGGVGLANGHDVVTLLRRLFPRIPVVTLRFENTTLAQQIQTMQRTLLFVALYSPSLSNVVFMPPGTSVVVLFPYKFVTDTYAKLCPRLNLHYASWENAHLGKSRYPDKCMIDERAFARFSKLACIRHPQCVECAREKAITTVQIRELEEIVLGLRSHVDGLWQLRREKLGLQRPNGQKSEGKTLPRRVVDESSL